MYRLRGLLWFISFAVLHFLCHQVSARVFDTNVPGPRDENNNPIEDWQDYNGYHNNGDVIGIELGSTYSRVGVFLDGEEGQFTLIPNDKGETQTPSCVTFTDNGVLVGSEAFEYRLINPSNTICDFQILLGRKFSEDGFLDEIAALPYEVVEDKKRGQDTPAIKVTVNGTMSTFCPEEVASHMISYLRHSTESYLGRKVWTAVITNAGHVWGDTKRQALQDAGTIAGLLIKRIVNEPQGAAIAHGINGLDGERKMLIYRLDPEKTELVLQNVDHGVFKILSTATDLNVAGKSFELLDRMLHRVIEDWMQELSHLIADTVASSHLKDELFQKAQTTLLTTTATVFEMDLASFMGPSIEGRVTTYEFTRPTLFASYRRAFTKVRETIDQLLINAEGGPLQRSQIDDIILIGDPDHLAMSQSLLEEYFDADKIRKNVPCNETIVRGAALEGIRFSGVEDTLCSLPVPTPLSLSIGIETRGGIFTTVFARNTPIVYGPTIRSRTISTVSDDQSKIEIKLFEGERGMAVDNKFLGTFVINNIPPAPKGVPQIKVWFRYDSHDDDVLHVFTKVDGETVDRENMLVIPIQYEHTADQIDGITVATAEHREEDHAAIKMAFERASAESEGEFGFSCTQCDEELLPIVEGRTFNPLSGMWEVEEQKVVGVY